MIFKCKFKYKPTEVIYVYIFVQQKGRHEELSKKSTLPKIIVSATTMLKPNTFSRKHSSKGRFILEMSGNIFFNPIPNG